MSQQSVHISMKSKKQHIRLWFECLQLCHYKSQYKDNLVNSKDFYEEWGEIQFIKFDDWWNEKKYLFEDLFVSEVTKVSLTPTLSQCASP